MLAKPWKDVQWKLSETTARAKKILFLLKKHYPHAQCSLNFHNPFELLVATVLSAQCTDERVNQVTPRLFERFPDAKTMSKADILELEKLVRSTGFYKNKAKNLKSAAQAIVEKFHGEIPKTVEELTQLSGVGVKTANVVLGTAFGIASGIAVDTHVARLARRMGLAQKPNPLQIQKELEAVIPQKSWIEASHLMIFHGRAICKARSPLCEKCFLQPLCPQRGVSQRRNWMGV